MTRGLAILVLPAVVAMALSVVDIPSTPQPEIAQGNTWHIYTVGWAGGPHTSTSLALDDSDWPYIAYFDNNESTLKLANWNGNTWVFQTVDGGVAANWEGSVSLALGSDGHPRMAYSDAMHRDLKYAEWNGSTWRIAVVEPSGAEGFGFVSLALDGGNRPHLSYGDFYFGNLRYATRDVTGWRTETVDVGGNAGYWTTIRLDVHDWPHIGYTQEANLTQGSFRCELKYAGWNGSAWTIETVDSTHFLDFPSSMDLDSLDSPHFSYIDSTQTHLKYARRNGSSWHSEVADSSTYMGSSNSLVLDSVDRPRIIYHVLSPSYSLKYAELNGTAWTTETIESFYDGRISLAVDSQDLPHASYVATVPPYSVKYATKAELSLTTRTRQISLDIDPDTLNKKSNGRWITAYLDVENASPGDIDPASLLLNDVVPPSWWDVQSDTTLMVKFDRAAVQGILPVSDSVDIKVIGRWKDGGSFEAHDTIRVIDP